MMKKKLMIVAILAGMAVLICLIVFLITRQVIYVPALMDLTSAKRKLFTDQNHLNLSVKAVRLLSSKVRWLSFSVLLPAV